MKITRKRWVIVRDKRDVFCGFARNYKFKPINDIGNAAIKTYLSRNKAISSFNRSWYSPNFQNPFDDDRYEAVEVAETIESIGALWKMEIC